MTEDDKACADTTPLRRDEETAQRVEKKPARRESPQQEHNDEDHG